LTALVDRLRIAPAAELVLEFAEMLSGHVRKEENILFQETQRLLSPERLSTLGQELAAAQRPPSCKR
jgi:hemerythrin-like domain-containing protein